MDGQFRSAVMGFHKKDVIAYLEKLNDQNDAMKAQLLERIDALDGEKQQLVEENAVIHDRLTSLDDMLTQQKQKTKELGDKVILLSSQVNQQRDKLGQQDRDLQQVQGERDELTAMVHQYEDKLKDYEEKEFEISTALVDAKIMAGNLVRQGRQQAEQQRRQILAGIEVLGGEMLSFQQELGQISQTVSDTASELQRRLDAMGDTIQLYRDRLQQLDAATAPLPESAPAPAAEPGPSQPSAAPQPNRENVRPAAPYGGQVRHNRMYTSVKKQPPASGLLRSIGRMLQKK